MSQLKHRIRMRKFMHDKYHARKAENICVRCGSLDRVQTYCFDCRVKRSKWFKEYRKRKG